MRPARSSYQTKKIAAQVNKAIVAQAEKKMNAFELNATFSSIGTTWVEHSWLPPFGSTSATRVGNKIAITELSFQGVSSEGKPTLPLMTTGTGSDSPRDLEEPLVYRSQYPHGSLHELKFPTSLQIDYQTQPTSDPQASDRTFTLTSPGKDSTGYLPPQIRPTLTTSGSPLW